MNGPFGFPLGDLPKLLWENLAGSVSLRPRKIIIGANLTLSDSGNSTATLDATGGGGSLTVREADGSPLVTSVSEIVVSNGSLVDNTGGSVSITTGGGGVGSSFVGASVYPSSTQSIADNTTTALLFDSENYDTNAIHDLFTNTSRLTVPTGKTGYWHLGGQIMFGGNPTGFRYAEIDLNGSYYRELFSLLNNDTHNFVASFSADLSLTAGDFLEIVVYQNRGGALNVGGGLDATCIDFRFLGA